MSELQPKENQLIIVDDEGNENLCEILFTFESERFNKKYVVFYAVADNNDDDDEMLELSAAEYVEQEDGMGELLAIEDDQEWEEVEQAIADFEKHYSGDCEDCEGDCDDDCEEGCCCHHHEE